MADLGPRPGGATGVGVELSADAPARVSIQWRVPRGNDGLRWRQSTFVDTTPRLVQLPLATFRPIAPASGAVPIERVHALLFVIDTVNARPGDRRTLTVHAARWSTALR